MDVRTKRSPLTARKVLITQFFSVRYMNSPCLLRFYGFRNARLNIRLTTMTSSYSRSNLANHSTCMFSDRPFWVVRTFLFQLQFLNQYNCSFNRSICSPIPSYRQEGVKGHCKVTSDKSISCSKDKGNRRRKARYRNLPDISWTRKVKNGCGSK